MVEILELAVNDIHVLAAVGVCELQFFYTFCFFREQKKFIGKPGELSLPLSKVLLYQYDKVLPYQVKQFRVR